MILVNLMDDTDCRTNDNDEDTPTLSAASMAALLEFYDDCDATKVADANHENMPSEDWQLSQFWFEQFAFGYVQFTGIKFPTPNLLLKLLSNTACYFMCHI